MLLNSWSNLDGLQRITSPPWQLEVNEVNVLATTHPVGLPTFQCLLNILWLKPPFLGMVDFPPKNHCFLGILRCPSHVAHTRRQILSLHGWAEGNGWTSQEHIGHWLLEPSGTDKFISPIQDIQDKLVMFISLPFFVIFGVG